MLNLLVNHVTGRLLKVKYESSESAEVGSLFAQHARDSYDEWTHT
jgi:hypothetical protein